MKTSTEIQSIVDVIGEEKAIEMIAKAGFDAWDFSMFNMKKRMNPFEGLFKKKYALVTNDYLKFARHLKQIGEENGMEAKIENMEFDSLLLALENGQVDAVIAGMTITDEKKDAVDFSKPYYTAKQVMIVKEDSDIQKASDMADKKIVVLQGFTGETCVNEMGYKYESFKKGTEAIMELVNGKCDVVVIDSATAEKYVNDNEGLKIVEDNDAFEAEEYGIAVKKGNTELLDKINKSLDKMMEDGTISELSAKYAESSDAE